MTSLSLDVDIVVESPLPADAAPDALTRLVRHVLESEGQAGEWTVAVALVSDPALRAMHRDFMGIDTETDVMTFPLEPSPMDETRGGDIVVSVERAAEQAPDYGLSTWEEVRFLVAHGALHLCGWVDAGDDDRRAMLARQQALIDSLSEPDFRADC